jgi:hypothetical protein
MHVTFIKESPFTSCQKLRILNTTCQWVLYKSAEFGKCYWWWVPRSMTENETSCLPRKLFKLCATPERQTSTIYSLVMKRGPLLSDHMTRPVLHLEILFRLKRRRKLPVLGFHNLVDVWHP